jgi:hypothetical protein
LTRLFEIACPIERIDDRRFKPFDYSASPDPLHLGG